MAGEGKVVVPECLTGDRGRAEDYAGFAAEADGHDRSIGAGQICEATVEVRAQEGKVSEQRQAEWTRRKGPPFLQPSYEE